ncbi:thiamine pyrophosphate-binding protein [Actinomyces sp.]|uniref:thiamine pyrophosphate-binding protein n=1 Tax=Actinomyces sp. TaxID=29317 RepID=UPI0026DA846D|nr:thiamine pyrophosphate-binding protein [Actinomyces sp.]MDO4899863.1 thiamine pyrophosphate-binding protein [Actinomyces sp.]
MVESDKSRSLTIEHLQATMSDTGAPRRQLPERVTGAEAIALILGYMGTKTVFAYAGTSELALCDAVDRHPSLELINGRGDKESAFMAAGGCLLRPRRAAAILHGARGLTNAAGAIADARRSESGTLFVVGLPSSTSVEYLPPHAENGLMPAIGTFVDWWWEAPGMDVIEKNPETARTFCTKVVEAVEFISQLPARPAMIGVPQDVAETAWIPAKTIVDTVEHSAEPLPDERVQSPENGALTEAINLVRQSRKPLILVDDYALRYPGIIESLDLFSRRINAPVLQLRYRRGPMLFQRLRSEQVNNFVGWLNQFSGEHSELLSECDLFITVEDRNIYQRVVGDLPKSRRIAITGFPEKTAKNKYIRDSDLVVAGSPAEAMAAVAAAFPAAERSPWWQLDIEEAARVTPEPANELVEYQRTEIVRALTLAFPDEHKQPVIVDDSQMFGGLISERYDLLPSNIRVFGSHGGFVGSGVSMATGLAIVERECSVLCTLGDQGLTNAIQGLVCAAEQEAPITYIVCNNGMSVSLTKQSSATNPNWFGGGTRGYLKNTPRWSYVDLARALGMLGVKVSVPIGPDEPTISAAAADLRDAILQCNNHNGPSLIELALPSDPAAWRGIWLTQGFEQFKVAKS